jgi:hypothetical protein
MTRDRRSRYEQAMRRLSLLLLLAVSVSAISMAGCGDIVIGPVDHSCPTVPGRSDGCGPGRG